MERGFGKLERADLTRLRDAVKAAQVPGETIRRGDVLAVHDAAPAGFGLTVDLEAATELGMPLLVVRVPIRPRSSPQSLGLSPREFEVTELMASGLANKEIAARLGIRTSTVKEHVHHILTKTGLPSRSAVTRAYLGVDGPETPTDTGPDSEDHFPV